MLCTEPESTGTLNQTKSKHTLECTIGEVDFLDFQCPTTEFGLTKKNSKTKVEKAFFFIVMPS
jgi:hypothetical protein